jgi:hypothetical protein
VLAILALRRLSHEKGGAAMTGAADALDDVLADQVRTVLARLGQSQTPRGFPHRLILGVTVHCKEVHLVGTPLVRIARTLGAACMAALGTGLGRAEARLAAMALAVHSDANLLFHPVRLSSSCSRDPLSRLELHVVLGKERACLLLLQLEVRGGTCRLASNHLHGRACWLRWLWRRR